MAERPLTFVVSGMLWGGSLVMKDEETESLWSHIMGKCMEGEHLSTSLTTIPSLMTDWETWTEMHPDTTVLLMGKTRFDFVSQQYQNLGLYVVGITNEKGSRAWKYQDLDTNSPVNDAFQDEELVVFFERDSGTAYLFERTVGERVLKFVQVDGEIIDEQTNSTWDARSGMATEGELEGTRLSPLVGITSYGDAWSRFYPDSSYWTK